MHAAIMSSMQQADYQGALSEAINMPSSLQKTANDDGLEHTPWTTLLV